MITILILCLTAIGIMLVVYGQSQIEDGDTLNPKWKPGPNQRMALRKRNGVETRLIQNRRKYGQHWRTRADD